MGTPVSSKAVIPNRVLLVLVISPWGVALLALLRIAYLLRTFYVDTAHLAPGTEIRPMGLTFQLFLAGFFAACFGAICGIGGFVACIRSRRWLVASLTIIAVVINCSIISMSSHWFRYVVDLRKLVLAD